MSELQKIAIVIDADNTQLPKIGDVLREVSTHGRIVVKRAYGNWKKESLKNWESEIKRLAIKAEQQFDHVTGKNATDMALIIDTIELLHSNTYDAFAIVSSDSDYTPLAIKLREYGVYVFGVGEKKTPGSFRNACDEFLFLENISSVAERVKSEDTPKTDTNEETENADSIEVIHGLLKNAFDTYQDNDGYVNAATVGFFIKRAKPDFDCRTYGFTKMSQLLEAFPQKYEVKRSIVKSTTVVAYRCID